MLKKLQKIRNSREEGFTLIELLVVVVIIGVLAAVALPIYNQQQTRAVEASVMGSLRAKVIAVQTFLIKDPDAVDSPTDSSATGRPISEATKSSGGNSYEFGVAEGPFVPDAAQAGLKLKRLGSFAKWDGWSVVVYGPTYGQANSNNLAVSYNSKTSTFTTWRGSESGVLQGVE